MFFLLFISPNEQFEYGYPHSNAFLCLFTVKIFFRLESEHYKPHRAACHTTKCDIINDIKLFPTITQNILLHISNFIQQTPYYISKCIRMNS